MDKEYEWLYLATGSVKHALIRSEKEIHSNMSAVCGQRPVWYDGRGWRGVSRAEKLKLRTLPHCLACCRKLGIESERPVMPIPPKISRVQRVYEGLQMAKPGEVLLFQKDNGEKVLIIFASVPTGGAAEEILPNVKKLAMRGGPPESHFGSPSSEGEAQSA